MSRLACENLERTGQKSALINGTVDEHWIDVEQVLGKTSSARSPAFTACISTRCSTIGATLTTCSPWLMSRATRSAAAFRT